MSQACVDSGLAHFSENWGFVSLSPMLGSNVFSLAFGRNLDAHAPHSASAVSTRLAKLASRLGLPSSTQCLEGRECYRDSLKVTIGACCTALLLAMYSGWRDQRRQARAALRADDVDVVWEDEEEE